MKKRMLAILFGALCTQAGAAVLNFDDLTSGNYVPPNYGGFIWGPEWAAYSDTDYANNYGNTYGSPSGDIAVYNGFGVTQVSLASGADFNFNGAYFTGWASNNGIGWFTATSLTISGYNNGSLVGQVSASLSTNQYDWVTANLNGVDEIRVTQNNGDSHWWLMDDFTYSATNNVPEPGSLALLSLGLVGAAYARRRKKT